MSKVADMAKSRSRRVPITFRFTPEAARRIKSFLADYAGKPLYLKPGAFAEAAILRYIETLGLAMATGTPLDRMTGRDDDRPPPTLPPPPRRRLPINASH